MYLSTHDGVTKKKIGTAQCGKIRIFLSLRFYVKSTLENVKFVKLNYQFFLQFRGYELFKIEFQPSKNARIHKISKV